MIFGRERYLPRTERFNELGWFFSCEPSPGFPEGYGMYQKTVGRVTVYVDRMLFFYTIKLYTRPARGLCTLERRVPFADGLEAAFKIGDEWLETYADADQSRLQADEYHIDNPAGYWGRKK